MASSNIDNDTSVSTSDPTNEHKIGNVVAESQPRPLILVLDCATMGCPGKRKPLGYARCASCMVAAYGLTKPGDLCGWEHDGLASMNAENPLDDRSSCLFPTATHSAHPTWKLLLIEKNNRIVWAPIGEGFSCCIGKLTGTDPNALHPITTVEDQKIARQLGFGPCDDEKEGDGNRHHYNLYRQSELDSLASFLKENKTASNTHLSLSPEYYAVAEKMRLARLARQDALAESMFGRFR